MAASDSFNTAYTGSRPDVRALIPPSAGRILDVGCSNGALGAAVKAQRPGAVVYGIELDAAMAAAAAGRLDKVFQADLADFDWSQLAGNSFDCLLFADILEHLVDPWGVMRTAVDYLAPGGWVVASLPNIRHLSSFYYIQIRGVWPLNDRGLFDKTHLRFFTLHTIQQLFAASGCRVERIVRRYRLLEQPHPVNAALQRVGGPVLNWLPLIRDYLTFQYLVLGQKTA